MPYVQCTNPFENREMFDKSFPGDFIAEGNQPDTRVVPHVHGSLHCALRVFDCPEFKNIINCLVLAAGGKKMSKRLKN